MIRKLGTTIYSRGVEIAACRTTNRQPWATYLALAVRIQAEVARP